MSATNRIQTPRLLTLAAFVLAAGVLAFRATDLFASPAPAPVGNSVERELTYLLEPITGAEKVRVSVAGRTERTILIMIDGPLAAELRPQIENVLAATLAYDPDADTLTLTEFPFARGLNGSLTPVQIAELTGLGLLCSLLLLQMMARIPVVAPMRADDTAPVRAPQNPQPVRPTQAMAAIDTDLQAATSLAESKPNETARLVRDWMSYAED